MYSSALPFPYRVQKLLRMFGGVGGQSKQIVDGVQVPKGFDQGGFLAELFGNGPSALKDGFVTPGAQTEQRFTRVFFEAIR